MVKFRNSPSEPLSLANEWIGSCIARRIGLPVPRPAIVDVSSWIVRGTRQMDIRIGGRLTHCAFGLNFGSTYLAQQGRDFHVVDYMPEALLDHEHVKNIRTFFGALAFDLWTCNKQGRQAVFWKRSRDKQYFVTFIDNGACFNAGLWESIESASAWPLFVSSKAYRGFQSIESFEPWVTKIEALDRAFLRRIADLMPSTWYRHRRSALNRLIEVLLRRASTLRETLGRISFGPEDEKSWREKFLQIISDRRADDESTN